MMVMLRLVQEFAAAAERSDTQVLREIATAVGDLVRRNASSEYWLKYARELHGNVLTTLADLEQDDAEVQATAITVLERNWSERGAGRDLLLDRSALQFGRLLRRRDLPGDRARSRDMGRYATWSAGWKVAMQSQNEHGLEIARNGVAAADELVSWCIEDGAVHDLVRALDARRGLVLKAAHIGRVVAHRLGEIGRHDLAEEWVEAEGRDRLRLRGPDGELSDWGGLRRKVLGVLTENGDMSEDRHFLDRVRRALHAHGSHCLVYLVPSNEHHEGLVVVVPADGEPSFSTCPELLTAQDSAVGRYQSAYDAWYEARTEDGEEYERWKDELDRICRWADDVVGAQLRRAADGRERVVLVPVGSLGLVPWHAAKRVADGVDRYLVQDLEISYAPSAEVFCDVVERRPVVGGNPLLVGNPTRDLPSGVVEAWSVRDAFYSGGLVMGSWSWFPLSSEPADDGAGTPAEVVSALAKPLPLLHLACHAVADMKEPLESRICLAGGTLSTQRLMDVRPTEVLPIGLVVLAGCTTNVSGVDYDEALSLSTSFLSLGARTVVGSMWKVPAGRTTVQLMFMFHHYLRVEGVASSSALRRAQLWMLDPGREFPASMPGKVRDMAPARGFDHADAVCWAGFTQQGV
ncbi:CHAT domain-containing protein [Kutzneria chonburiensis]|uniref:CHAT domain-containing protein n=1 Tax=Kutzneria chonburiensis TaxID=1483604 RepID=A0ABV6MPT8_9PSEU|nr:CHAT domain-containing protein [Kutzneria chonburiensis]